MMKTIEGITLDWLYERVKEQDGCLCWTGSMGGGKSPQARIGNQAMGMRRVMWELSHEKKIPTSHQVSPKCGNLRCVHPDHMVCRPRNTCLKGVEITHVHRANIAKGRRNGSKFTDEVIAQVRASNGSLEAVAAEFGMDSSYVWQIRTGIARKDFTNPYLQLMK